MKNFMKKGVFSLMLLFTLCLFGSISAKAAAVPANLKQTDDSTSAITFTWDAVPNASDYQTSWSPDGINWSTAERSWGITETITKLNAGRSFYVKVQSIDKDTKALSAFSAPIEVVTAPDASTIKPVTTVSILDTSISLSWLPASGATCYEVRDHVYGSNALYCETPTNAATIGNLSPGTYYGVDIYPVRVSSTGYRAMGDYIHNYIKTAGQSLNPVNNTVTIVAPGAASTANFKAIGNSNGYVYFQAADPAGKAHGYEVEVRKLKGNKKVKTITSTSTYSSSVKFSKNTAYKYRIRYFTVSGTQKLYGGYSGYRYFCIQKVSGKKHYRTNSTTATFKLSWSKVSGAKGYTVYISKSSSGKYKKVKKLSSKKKSITIKKYGKSKLKRFQTYYIKVVPTLKDGKKTVKNDTQLIVYK